MQEFSYNLNDQNEAEAVYTDQPDLYLYEPNASLLKAGAFKCLCRQYKVQKLHSQQSFIYIRHAASRNFQDADSAS